MKCPKCGTENNDGAKFCKGCGGSLQTNPSSDNLMSQSKSNNNTLIICVTVLLAIIVIAGAFLLLNDGSDDSSVNEVSNDDSVSEDAEDSSLEESDSSSMTILSESFDGEIPFDNYIKIDNSQLPPDVVAKMIQEKFNL